MRCRYEQGHSASLQRLVARATGSLASISAPAAARHAGPRQQHATSLSDEAVEAAETESMRALEWSAVLKQVGPQDQPKPWRCVGWRGLAAAPYAAPVT